MNGKWDRPPFHEHLLKHIDKFIVRSYDSSTRHLYLENENYYKGRPERHTFFSPFPRKMKQLQMSHHPLSPVTCHLPPTSTIHHPPPSISTTVTIAPNHNPIF
jgi:hypothetical protein